jgi:hypothetical protein
MRLTAARMIDAIASIFARQMFQHRIAGGFGLVERLKRVSR